MSGVLWIVRNGTNYVEHSLQHENMFTQTTGLRLSVPVPLVRRFSTQSHGMNERHLQAAILQMWCRRALPLGKRNLPWLNHSQTKTHCIACGFAACSHTKDGELMQMTIEGGVCAMHAL
jgi:hypothetical protein